MVEKDDEDGVGLGRAIFVGRAEDDPEDEGAITRDAFSDVVEDEDTSVIGRLRKLLLGRLFWALFGRFSLLTLVVGWFGFNNLAKNSSSLGGLGTSS